MHIAAVGDWTKSLLALVKDGRDDAGRTTGPRLPWWASKADRQAGVGGTDQAAEAGADEEKGSSSDAGGGAAVAALRPDMPTIYLRGPFGAPAMAFESYDVLVLCSTGVG